MKFAELARKRRSVRKYEDKKVGKDVIESILESTFTAPSSKNVRSTRILVTDKPEIMKGIAAMRSTGTAFAKDAPLAFIVMADDSETDLWRINSSISAIMLQFACEDLGLGSCWMQVDGRPHRNEDQEGPSVEEYLHILIPETAPYRILCVVAAGYPAIEPKPHSPREEDKDKVIFKMGE